MSIHSNPLRGLVLIAISAALLATSGCGLFRSKTGYDLPPEARPLEVPPDLDTPVGDGSMSLPGAPPSAAPNTASGQSAQATSGFSVSQAPAAVFQRVGEALDQINGVTIGERAALLNLYSVQYQGQTVLVRISPAGEGARVSVSGQDGRELGSGPGLELLDQLRQALGGA